MSVYATTWVWDHSESTGNARLVLLAIADAADADGDNAWPKQDKLARMARVSVRTVRRIVADLIELGELEVIEHAGGTAHTREDRRPHLYRLIKMTGQDGRTLLSPRSTTGGQTERHGRTNGAPRADTVVLRTSFKNTPRTKEPSGGAAAAAPAEPEEDSVARAKDAKTEQVPLFEVDAPVKPEPEFNAGALVGAYVASYSRHHEGLRPGRSSIGRVSRDAKTLIASVGTDSGPTESELIMAAEQLGTTPYDGLERQVMMGRRSTRGPSRVIPHGDPMWSAPAAAQVRQAEEDEFMSSWLVEQLASEQVSA